MYRIILCFIAITIGLSAHADYTVQTNQSLYSNPILQPIDYATNQPDTQQYYPGYCQIPYQNQIQTQPQYFNPYQYRNQYAYGNYGNALPYYGANSILSSLGNTNGTTQVARNIGRSMLYSLMRGY